jgi:hypothetical protein
MAHATCIAVSTGVHLHRTTYPAMLDSTPRLFPHATTSTTAAMSNALRIRPVAEEPMPARPACGSRAASCSLPWPVSPVHHVSCLSRSPRQNSRSRESTSPEYYRFVYSGIDNCTRLLLQHAALDAQNAALLPRQTPYLRYPQHYPVHSHYAVMINTSSTFNPPTTLQPSPHQRLR